MLADDIPRFEFDGVQFGGLPTDILVEDWDTGQGEVRSQDAEPPGRAGLLVGRDFPAPPSWVFELVTNRDTVLDAMATVESLGGVWRSSRWSKPGVVGVLRYWVGDRARRVVGRPRRFSSPNGDVQGQRGAARFMCDFQLTDPRSFDDNEGQVTLSLVPESTGGIIFPLVFPMTTTITGGVRAGFVTNDGDAPAPVTVTFNGPVTNPKIFTDDWEIGITGKLAYDESVTVDCLAMTVKRQDGANVAGRLTRGTRLRNAALAPGQQEIKFTGADSTGTATAVVSWRNSYWSI